MKKFYKYIAVLLLSASFTGCNDFLTLIPESNYSVAGAYKSQSDFVQAIAGVYAAQQELYRSNNCWHRLMISRSGDTRNGSSYVYGIDSFTDNDSNAELLNAWSKFWQIIGRCNQILEFIDKGDFSDEKMRDYVKGEAYALRAYSYWNLGWMFGGMPIIDKVYTVQETKNIARSSQEETFSFAAEDYKKAASLLPDKWSGKDEGRFSKYAAEGMLARLLMFQNKLSDAKPYLANIINSGLYSMEKEYVGCFTDDKDNGSERIFEIQFTGGQLGEGQSLATGMLPEGFKDLNIMPFSGYSTAMKVSVDAQAMHEEGDLRKDASLIGNLTINGMIDNVSVFILKYNHYKSYTPKDQQDWANNIPVLRYTDVKMMYAEVLNEESYQSNGEAFTIINDVRRRAGLEPYTIAQLPDQSSFREALRRERHVEFAFEGLRWNDLVRWGIAKQVINKHFMLEDEGEGRYKMEDHQTVFAIPAEELKRYNNESIMWQNTGY